MEYQFFKLEVKNNVGYLAFNRPEKANSLHGPAWHEMKSIFEAIHENEEIRVVVFSGEGKHFCAGIDLELLMGMQQYQGISCEARKREKVRKFIVVLQDCITAIEKCRKPVLAAISGACVGGGVDIASACDMRYCSEDAYFSVKEIDLGLVADIGTLQRLPKIISPAIAAELAYTGRKMNGSEAREERLVNRCFSDKETLMEEVSRLAEMIASKSPVCIRGTKEILLHTRDHSVPEALDYMATWNAAMLLSSDLMESFQATMEKRKPVYEG